MTNLDADSRRMLELASAARTPSAEDKARVAERLSVALGASAALGASSAHAAATQGAGSSGTGGGVAAILKWIAAGAVIAAASISLLVLVSRPSAPVKHPTPPPQAAGRAPALPEPVSTPMPSAQAEEASAEPAVRTQPAPRRVEHHRSTAPLDTLQDELALLHNAQAAWRAHDARSALAALQQHKAQYPRSQLVVERDVLWALCLCDTGQQADARRLARSVLARAPATPMRAALEQSCAMK
jgi:hypothetical protein